MLTNCTCVYAAEAAIDAHGEEQVVGIAQLVQLSEQIVNRGDACQLDASLGAKAGDDGERRQIGIGSLSDCNISLQASETPVDDHHLAVEVSIGAETEIAMALELADGNDTLRDALDQRAGSRDLEQGRMRNFQVVGE